MVTILAYTLTWYHGCGEFTASFWCNSTNSCISQQLLCPALSNCSVGLLGSQACQYGTVNAYYANSLYLTASGFRAVNLGAIYILSKQSD